MSTRRHLLRSLFIVGVGTSSLIRLTRVSAAQQRSCDADSADSLVQISQRPQTATSSTTLESGDINDEITWILAAEGRKVLENADPDKPNGWYLRRGLPEVPTRIQFRNRVISTGWQDHTGIVVVTGLNENVAGFMTNQDRVSGAWRVVPLVGNAPYDRDGIREGRYDLGITGEWCEGELILGGNKGRVAEFTMDNGERRIFEHPEDIFGRGDLRVGLQAFSQSVVEVDFRVYQPATSETLAVNSYMSAEKLRLASSKQVVITESQPREFTNYEEPRPEFKTVPLFEGVRFQSSRLIEASIELPADGGRTSDTIRLTLGAYLKPDYQALSLQWVVGDQWRFRYERGTEPERSYFPLTIQGNRLDINYLINGQSVYVEHNGIVRRYDLPQAFTGDNGRVTLSVPRDYGYKVHALAFS